MAAHSGHVPPRFEKVLTKGILEILKTKTTTDSIWIARDEDGTLCAYNQKPDRYAFDGIWLTENGNDRNYEVLNDDWFPEVTWENSPIELVPKIMIDENTSLDKYINTIIKEKEEL